ncbi:MAG TPA: hypothetical protein PLH93_05200 [Flavobacteriales bacterium]|nr:hypothetical protein [Flavobacteriales bacterium]
MRTTASILAILGLVGLRPMWAQESDESPYSSYGFGDLLITNQVVQAAMGGVGVAATDPYSVSAQQPASYAHLLKPTFEIGGLARWVRLRAEEGEQQRSAVRPLGLSVGVPFARGKAGLALGLSPFTDVGYRISDSGTLPDGGTVRYTYEGSGGLNKAFVGVGTTVWQKRDSLGNGHKLTAGGNFVYLFGGIERTRKAYYPEGGNYLNTQAFSSLVMRGPAATLGLQYIGDLRRRTTLDEEPLRYTVALSVDPGFAIGARRTELVNSFTATTTGVETFRDTIVFSDGARGTVGLPTAWGLGLGLVSPTWTVMAEARLRDWSSLRLDVEGYTLPEDLGPSIAYAIGAAWTPLGLRNGSFLGRTTYRLGFRHAQDYLRVGGEALRETAVSAGLSLPLMGSMTRSRFTIGADLGQRTSPAAGRISEGFLDLYVGFTITPDIREVWFRKRRIE